jgi:hypothetical protein
LSPARLSGRFFPDPSGHHYAWAGKPQPLFEHTAPTTRQPRRGPQASRHSPALGAALGAGRGVSRLSARRSPWCPVPAGRAGYR